MSVWYYNDSWITTTVNCKVNYNNGKYTMGEWHANGKKYIEQTAKQDFTK